MAPAERVPANQRPALFRYGVAVLAFLAALAARLWLEGSLPPGFPFLTFFPAVILTAFVAGLGPGILAAVLSGMASWYLFIPPFQSFELTGGKALALAFYVFIVAVDIALIHAMGLAVARYRLQKERAAEAEARAKALAESREVLFTELQHRVSNNLQLVAALLTLQRAGVEDEKAQRALTEAASRLGLIAKIQRSLHDPNRDRVEFGTFLEELAHDVLQASGAGNIVCLVRSPEVVLPPDRAIPVGLIVTELVSNALEHAFQGQSRGTIRVDVRPLEGGLVEITVEDDGAGLPPQFDPAKSHSLGLRLVRNLADQIGGRFEMFARDGTVARLTFATAPA